jgi:hypothetical protein
MKYFVLLLVLVGSLFGSVIVSNDVHIMNHGGWGLSYAIGADKGDKITIDVTCDHTYQGGECFDGPPKLDDPISGIPFTLASDTFAHQIWRITVPTTGLHYINAQYFWVGPQVHYFLHITATEKLT